jgi:hypothetical protein
MIRGLVVLRAFARGMEMFRDLPFVAAVGLALSACAMDMIKKGMTPYLGQPASALFSKLGYPTRQDQIAGKKFYIWTRGGLRNEL